MAKYTRQPKPLLATYADIKASYAGSLSSDNQEHIRYAKKRIAEEFKHYLVGFNINCQNHSDWRYHSSVRFSLSFAEVIGLISKGKLFNKVVKRSLAEDDPEELLMALNRSEFRSIRHGNTDWIEFLEDNFGGAYANCEDCGVLENTDSMTWAYHGDRCICESCRDRNYHWSDYQDTYIHDDDEDTNDLIGEYHSSSENLDHIPSEHDKHKTPIYLGLELEMETSEGADRLYKAEQLLDAIGKYNDGKNTHQYCLLENDGSLDDGFEMVTGYTGLDVHAKQLEFFKQPFKGMRSHDTRTCGLHIHICKTGMTMAHASKLILFINESGNQKLIKAIARRENPDYAKIKNKKADYRWLRNAKQSSGLRSQLSQLNEDRYEALNFKNYNTVEFRMFRGTLKYSTIMACLEFTYASWHFARDTGLQNLTTEDFLQYISKPSQLKTTKFLRSYLQEKGFNIPTPVKQNPRIATQPATDTVEV